MNCSFIIVVHIKSIIRMNIDILLFRSEEELHSVKVTHKPPEGFVDKVSFYNMAIFTNEN